MTKKPKSKQSGESPPKSNNSTIIIILLILASPILLPLAISAFAVIFSLIITVFALVVAFGAAGIGMIIASLVYLPISVVVLTQNAPAGLATLGSALLVLGLSAFFLAASIALARVSVKGITSLVNKTVNRKEAK